MDLVQSTPRNEARTPHGGHSAHGRMPRVAALLAVGLLASGCAASASAVGNHTARVVIDGKEIADEPTVRCQQTGWVWIIESVDESPGFTAQVRTGAAVEPRAVQFNDLGGFTGGYSDVTFGTAEATVVDGTFTISGTADGFDDGDFSNKGTADFEIRTAC